MSLGTILDVNFLISFNNRIYHNTIYHNLLRTIQKVINIILVPENIPCLHKGFFRLELSL